SEAFCSIQLVQFYTGILHNFTPTLTSPNHEENRTAADDIKRGKLWGRMWGWIIEMNLKLYLSNFYINCSIQALALFDLPGHLYLHGEDRNILRSCDPAILRSCDPGCALLADFRVFWTHCQPLSPVKLSWMLTAMSAQAKSDIPTTTSTEKWLPMNESISRSYM
ncbi:hypothetical protein, partial [Rhizorhapis sp. SPR117]|uniref:hypothetical protein n=1 Tax=Rhizorhapis sp. SPR117 TaxID=2912611 RepID=UPI001F30AECF|nr:hypothetical protein [Rhizorhapis sp. SPR117]